LCKFCARHGGEHWIGAADGREGDVKERLGVE
jgi:hypothetical protein